MRIDVMTGGGSSIRRDLASGLRPLAERTMHATPDAGQPPFVSSFVSRQKETIVAFSTPVTGLVVVIEGCKEVRWGAEERRYRAGDVFLLPAGSRVDVINDPDAASGFYRALFLGFSRDLIIAAARLWPEFVGYSEDGLAVDLGPELFAALLHVGGGLTGASRQVVEHRLLEVILVLAEQGAMRLRPKYVEGSVTEAVRLLVRHKLDREWSAASVAEAIEVSEATLRRRLRSEGQSLGDLLRAERMRAAHVLLRERDADVAEAMAATGYASRSHFGRQFRQVYGMTPTAARHQRRRGSSG